MQKHHFRIGENNTFKLHVETCLIFALIPRPVLCCKNVKISPKSWSSRWRRLRGSTGRPCVTSGCGLCLLKHDHRETIEQFLEHFVLKTSRQRNTMWPYVTYRPQVVLSSAIICHLKSDQLHVYFSCVSPQNRPINGRTKLLDINILAWKTARFLLHMSGLRLSDFLFAPSVSQW